MKGKTNSTSRIIETIGIVPNEYQLVDYLESNRKQYVDIDYIPDCNTCVELKCKCDVTIGTNFLYGARHKIENTAFGFAGSVTKVYHAVYNNDVGAVDAKYNVLTNDVFVITQNKNITYINDEKVSELNYTNFVTPNTMMCFACHSTNTIEKGKVRIYYMKIYDNGELISFLLPVYRKKDNITGLYCAIRNRFFECESPEGVQLKYGKEIDNIKKIINTIR